MKAISLLQPYATLWALGIKTCETRSWPTQFRGEILIHASKGYSAEGEALWTRPHADLAVAMQRRFGPGPSSIPAFSELPRGAIIGSVEIRNCVLMTPLLLDDHGPQPICSHPDRFSTFLTQVERACGNWQAGRFAFVGVNHKYFDSFAPARGQLGIWEYDPEAYNKERADREEEKRDQRQRQAERRRQRKALKDAQDAAELAYYSSSGIPVLMGSYTDLVNELNGIDQRPVSDYENWMMQPPRSRTAREVQIIAEQQAEHIRIRAQAIRAEAEARTRSGFFTSPEEYMAAYQREVARQLQARLDNENSYFDLSYTGPLPTTNKYQQPAKKTAPPALDPTQPVKRKIRLHE